ncbi:MAG: HD domain-containing protein [Promethearchaeota archaeon]
MVDHQEFTELIKSITDKNTLDKANTLSDTCIRIIKLEKENGLIETEIQGNTINPYKLNISLSQNSLYGIIDHDCPDYLARKRPNNKFCKHIIKFFYFLNDQDSDLAINVVNKISKMIFKTNPNKKIDLFDLNNFVNPGILNQLDIDYKGFEYFFDLLQLEDSTRECLREIIRESKKLPAALGGFHGAYEGGLFDHILLVTNYAYKLSKSKDYNVDIKKAVLTAIYHDFGKISYYSFKSKQIESKFVVKREELDLINEEIVKRFQYVGRDYHVEEALAVLKNYRHFLFYDDEICQAIIFHHGEWSKYYPIEMNELAKVVHKADMIASQTYFI